MVEIPVERDTVGRGEVFRSRGMGEGSEWRASRGVPDFHWCVYSKFYVVWQEEDEVTDTHLSENHASNFYKNRQICIHSCDTPLYILVVGTAKLFYFGS